MMTDIEFNYVLEFLRKNGLSASESALMKDVMDKYKLGSSDFDIFLFPMVPPPRPLRIPSARQLPFAGDDDNGRGESSKNFSDDEFVSLGSSTTELCSSEFTNPYGIRTSRPASQASSDRLSQFGTARDYPDFDMQNDLFWNKEKDEDYAMPPLLIDRDLDCEPSEDKYITTDQAGEVTQDQFVCKYDSDRSSNFATNRWDLASRDDLENGAEKDCYEFRETFRVGIEEQCNDYGLITLQISEENENQSISHVKTSLNDSAEPNTAYNLSGGDINSVREDNESYDRDEVHLINNGVYGQPFEQEALVEEEASISEELTMYDNKGDEYEMFELRIIHRKNRTGFEENKDLPIVINSIIAGRYYVTEYLGSAAFSKVIQAHDLKSGMDVCVKIIKNNKDFFDQSLDEIKLLKLVNKHDPYDKHHILRLYDYFYHQEHLFIVTELLRANLYEFQTYNLESGADLYFTLHRLQAITRQCLEAVSYLHDLGIIHCDLKPENILIKSYRRCEIKVIDLGSSCFRTDNLSLYVQSRSYRAPEVLLGLPYDQKIDLWSVGCILAELCTGEVLFPNEAVVIILARMIGLLGPIDTSMLFKGQNTDKYFTKEFVLYHINEETDQLEYIIPDESSLEHHLQISDSGLIDFLKFLLQINPKKRPTAREALLHPWFSHSYPVNSF